MKENKTPPTLEELTSLQSLDLLHCFYAAICGCDVEIQLEQPILGYKAIPLPPNLGYGERAEKVADILRVDLVTKDTMQEWWDANRDDELLACLIVHNVIGFRDCAWAYPPSIAEGLARRNMQLIDKVIKEKYSHVV